MGARGINVHTYKAHSLRWATATHLMAKGLERGLVQSRGKWTSSQTLDKYYNRLHQQTDWEAHLGENAAGRRALTCVVLGLTPSLPKTTKEVERREGEAHSTTQIDALRAQSVLRPLHAEVQCPSCGENKVSEAAYQCTTCKSTYHVRCMGPKLESSKNLVFKTTCYPCTMATQSPSQPWAKKRLSKGLTGEMIDVMGVCNSNLL